MAGWAHLSWDELISPSAYPTMQYLFSRTNIYLNIKIKLSREAYRQWEMG